MTKNCKLNPVLLKCFNSAVYPNLIFKVFVVSVVVFTKLKIKPLKIQIGNKEKKVLNKTSGRKAHTYYVLVTSPCTCLDKLAMLLPSTMWQTNKKKRVGRLTRFFLDFNIFNYKSAFKLKVLLLRTISQSRPCKTI